MITVVTGNKGKAAEIAAYFAGIEDINAVSLDLTEPQMDSLADIARAKAQQAYEQLHQPLIVDDTGLFIAGLAGFPGPYAAYVQKTIGNAGILKLMTGLTHREAYFETVIGFADREGIHLFSGRVEGSIAENPCGNAGFGYDPVFMVSEKTLAEMTLSEKNRISHRAIALKNFKDWYVNQRNG